jgi:pSer/pThr/pTyr-binding forkhead associated (FHA) protein
MLKIQLKGKKREPMWVVEKVYSIGTSPNNNLVIDDESLSPVHAKLITRETGLYVKDNNSSSGCFVNAQRVTQKEIVPGDTLRLGQVEIEVLDPRGPVPTQAVENQIHGWSLVADSNWLSGKEFTILRRCTTIGRSSQCDITIPGTHLSRQHAELTCQGNLLHVRDLASTNGTYINDERITEGIARHGDRLRLDVYSFRVIGPGDETNKIRLGRAPVQPAVKRATVAETAVPKRWKTRPTSPGNRAEPIRPPPSRFVTWFSLGLCLLMLAAVAYLITLR